MSTTDLTIVLVHGAFADASCYLQLIQALQAEGLNVAAVQNDMHSLVADAENTKNFIEAQPTDVLLVAHSYGGLVSSIASAHPKVKGLVLMAAFAGDKGESFGAITAAGEPSEGLLSIVPNAQGTLFVDPTKYATVFANGIPEGLANAMAVCQRGASATIMGEEITDEPGWKNIPTWYIVATQDRIIPPPAQEFFAQRINAQVTHVESGHAIMVSAPDQVANVIKEAAASLTTVPA